MSLSCSKTNVPGHIYSNADNSRVCVCVHMRCMSRARHHRRQENAGARRAQGIFEESQERESEPVAFDGMVQWCLF